MGKARNEAERKGEAGQVRTARKPQDWKGRIGWAWIRQAWNGLHGPGRDRSGRMRWVRNVSERPGIHGIGAAGVDGTGTARL